MRLSQTVSAKSQQSQRPDPRQIFASEILAWTTPELEIAIERELAENPALELREDASFSFLSSDRAGGGGYGEVPSPAFGSERSALMMESRRPDAETFASHAERAAFLSGDAHASAKGDGLEQNALHPTQSHKSTWLPVTPAAGDLLDPFEMLAGQETLRDHLRAQVGQVLSEGSAKSNCLSCVAPILRYLIECVDERGYLAADMCEIAERFHVTTSNVESAVGFLQRMEPSGVGARDLRECLVLQCGALMEAGETPGTLPLEVLTHCWDDLVAHREGQIALRLQRTVEQVRRAIFFLRNRLVPYPAGAFRVRSSGFAANAVPLVRADVVFVRLPDGIRVEAVRCYDDALRVAPLWEQWAAVPQSAVSARESEDDGAATRRYAREQVEQARTFLTGLARRGRTLNRLARALAERQDAFVETGDRAFLRPLTRQMLADELGLDESVVSRAIADKWAQLPTGDIVPLDAFFGVANAAREALVRLVADEDVRNPYSDDEIAAHLTTLGFPVARRTVAKYRSQERILSNRQRRHLK